MKPQNVTTFEHFGRIHSGASIMCLKLHVPKFDTWSKQAI